LISVILYVYTIILVVLFFYSMHSYILLYLYAKSKISAKNAKNNKEILTEYPHVTVQLPIFNEKYVISRLVNSVLALDYPKNRLEVQVLDDSNDETTTVVANLVEMRRKQGFDIKQIRRGSRKGFKAGALQFGTEIAKGEYIAIFDADFVPPRDFLKKLLPEFAAPDVGGVQARWGHLNPDESFLTRSQAIGLDNHFIMEQGLRSQGEFFINFNGTCGIWRKSAIIDAEGWQGDTLAEDLDLSYRVQLRGWKIVYRGDCMVPGELPGTADSYRIQQNRWAKGTFQVACKLLPQVLRSRLSPLAKYEAFVHLTCHVNFVAMLCLGILSLPIVYFKVEGLVSDAYYIFASFFTLGVFGYPVLYFLSQKESYSNYKKKLPYIAGVVAYSMGLSLSNTKAILEAVFRKRNIFTRTPKAGGMNHAYRIEARSIVPILEIALGVYIMFGLVYVICNFQIVLIPFLLAYGAGFLSLGISSVKGGMSLFKPQEVLCSKENS
jgi:cellulose synthase/poly-beta-1,6-N-acetylglucosamine synthase-like glycosyltransferase